MDQMHAMALPGRESTAGDRRRRRRDGRAVKVALLAHDSVTGAPRVLASEIVKVAKGAGKGCDAQLAVREGWWRSLRSAGLVAGRHRAGGLDRSGASGRSRTWGTSIEGLSLAAGVRFLFRAGRRGAGHRARRDALYAFRNAGSRARLRGDAPRRVLGRRPAGRHSARQDRRGRRGAPDSRPTRVWRRVPRGW